MLNKLLKRTPSGNSKTKCLSIEKTNKQILIDLLEDLSEDSNMV